MIDTKEYAKALFLLAEERGAMQAILSDFKEIEAALKEAPDYSSLLDSPAIAREEKERLIDEAFATVDEDLRSFLKILAVKHSLYALPRTAEAYEALCDEAMGILRAEAVTAVALSDAQKERLASKLSEQTKKTVVLSNTVDASVLGSVRLRFMGKQWDASLKSRLDAIHESLQSTALGVEFNGR